MTFDLDLYLQGYLTVTLLILWIIFICGTNTTWEGTCVMYHFQVNRSNVTRFIRIFAVEAGGILLDHWSTISSLNYFSVSLCINVRAVHLFHYILFTLVICCLLKALGATACHYEVWISSLMEWCLLHCIILDPVVSIQGQGHWHGQQSRVTRLLS